MAQKQNSVTEDFEQSEILSGNSACRAMSFEESDVCNYDNSLCAGVITSPDKPHSVQQSLTNDVSQSTELVDNESSEIEVKKSSANVLVESQYPDSHASSDCNCSTPHAQCYSTPAVVQCSSNPFVSERQLQDCEFDQKSVSNAGSESKFVVTVGQCNQENVVTDNSPVSCQCFVIATTAAAAADDDDDVADDMVLSCNKDASTTSPDCKPIEIKNESGGDHPHVELASAFSTAEEIPSADGDKEVDTCQSAADEENSQRNRSQTVDSTCLKLSELLQELCVIDGDNDKPVVSGTTASDMITNTSDVIIDNDTGKLVLNATTTSGADVSDSFDLDFATKDLERAVSAGMLDFLLESYEDSYEDLSSELLDQELDECSFSDDGDDTDEDGDGGSERTLTDSSSDGSVIVVVDDDDDDEDVLKCHERTKNNSNCDNDPSTTDVGSNVADLMMLSYEDNRDDDEDVLKRHERIRRCVKNICNHDNNINNSANVDLGTAIIKISDHVTDDDDVDHNIDIEVDDVALLKPCDAKDVGDDALLQPFAGIDIILNSSGNDNVECAVECADADISNVDIICAAAADEDDDDEEEDVLTRHERVKKMLKDAAAIDVDDSENCKAGDSDLVFPNINCSCMDDDHSSSLSSRCLITAGNNNDNSSADSCDTGDNSVAGTQLPVTQDRVTISEKCVDMQNNEENIVVEQSLPCRNAETMSPVVKLHHVISTPDVISSACIFESPVCAAICSCTQPPVDIQHTNSHRHCSTNTSLSVDGLAAGSTSTPSACSQHSQMHHSVIHWQDGIYSGLCRHSDGSDICTSFVAS